MSDPTKKPFVKEPRYVVFKLKDIAAYLDDDDSRAIARIGGDIAMARRHDGKPPFNAVVVEQDWPEFEPVWAMIEARMTGKQHDILPLSTSHRFRKQEKQRDDLLAELKAIKPVMVRVSKTSLERVAVYPADEIDAAIAKVKP